MSSSAASLRGRGGFPWSTLFGATAVAALVTLAAGAGHLGRIQTAGLGLGLGVVIAARCWRGASGVRLVIDAAHALSLAGLALALLQPEQRGTHRWLSITGFDAPVALLASVCAPLQLALAPERALRRASALAALCLIVASSSFTLAAVSTCACAAAGLERRKSSVVVAFAALTLMGALALGNANRARRIHEFAAPSSQPPYQVQRARATLSSLDWKPRPTPLEPLPCAATDFALLDLGRRSGSAAIAAWVVSQACLLVALSHARRRTCNRSAPLVRAATGLAFASCVAHVGVNFTVLPPFGTLAAFTGASGAGWFFSGFVFAIVPAANEREIAGADSPPTHVARRWAVPAAMLAWTTLCIAIGWRAAARTSRAEDLEAELPFQRVVEAREVALTSPAHAVGSGSRDVDVLLDAHRHDAEALRALAANLVDADARSRLRNVRVWCACGACPPRIADPEQELIPPILVRVEFVRGEGQDAPASPTSDVRLPETRPTRFLAQDLMAHLEPRLRDDAAQASTRKRDAGGD